MTTILEKVLTATSNRYRNGQNRYQQVPQESPDIIEARALRALLAWLESPEAEPIDNHTRNKLIKVTWTALLNVMDRVRNASAFNPAPK